jgi:hypothetical protein
MKRRKEKRKKEKEKKKEKERGRFRQVYSRAWKGAYSAMSSALMASVN